MLERKFIDLDIKAQLFFFFAKREIKSLQVFVLEEILQSIKFLWIFLTEKEKGERKKSRWTMNVNVGEECLVRHAISIWAESIVYELHSSQLWIKMLIDICSSRKY